MSCGLYCCGAKTIAVGDEFTTQALDYVKTSAQGALVGQLFIVVLGLIAVINFGVMGLALESSIAGLSTMTAAVAVMHSMLAGAMYASQKPSMKVSAIVFPVTAVGGIAEGILYAYMPSWQEADILAELFGFQLIGGTLFTVSAFWLAAVSAVIGWGLNYRPPRRREEEQPLLINAHNE